MFLPEIVERFVFSKDRPIQVFIAPQQVSLARARPARDLAHHIVPL
jgi:ethanolamine utilization microcompartment shell protein EutS